MLKLEAQERFLGLGNRSQLAGRRLDASEPLVWRCRNQGLMLPRLTCKDTYSVGTEHPTINGIDHPCTLAE